MTILRIALPLIEWTALLPQHGMAVTLAWAVWAAVLIEWRQ